MTKAKKETKITKKEEITREIAQHYSKQDYLKKTINY
jgi:hypothetical protein